MLTNDILVGTAFSVSLVTPPARGNLTLSADGNVVYTMMTAEDDFFEYRVVNELGESSIGRVNLFFSPN